MADGIFTPAISVTSAVGGIAVAKPSASNDITAISIVGIFFILLYGLPLITKTVFFICPFFCPTIWNAPLGLRLLTRYFP